LNTPIHDNRLGERQVSHPHKTASKIIVFYHIIFTILDRGQETVMLTKVASIFRVTKVSHFPEDQDHSQTQMKGR
jgi:hypothetical protein